MTMASFPVLTADEAAAFRMYDLRESDAIIATVNGDPSVREGLQNRIRSLG